MPLLEKKASDLLDAFVGQTEQNLAAAFLQAHKENAILLIDEADSFLMDRNQPQMRWEVSQTNELLCQMEAYNGLFIATTNRFDELDSAALRRFDIKVRFRCLMPQQVWLWFCHFLQQTAEELTAYRNRVLALEDVTPGLFAIATRRQALYGQALHAQALFDLLQAESAHQRGWGERRPIGFTHG
jgi:SpoVK/Ycf46/Vps4 family AAA+-type ATPase